MSIDSLARKLDAFLRHRDFDLNRTVGGQLDRHFGVSRHAMSALLVSVGILFFLWLGPTPTLGLRLWIALGSLFIGVPVFIWGMRATAAHSWRLAADLGWQLLWFFAVGGIVVVSGTNETDVPGGGPLYRHVILFAVAVFALCLLVAAILAHQLFKPQPLFGAALNNTELFLIPAPPQKVTPAGLAQGVLRVFFRRTLELLWIPAMAVLLARGGAPFWGVRESALLGVGAGVVNFGLLVLADSNTRLDTMITLTEAALFRGTALLVSLAIIAIAIARLADISYITTLLDSPSTLLAIVCYGLAAYVMSWWYDYWTGRFATEQLVCSLGSPITAGTAVAYNIAPSAVTTSAPAANRVLQVHGSNRFVVTCPATKAGDSPFFQTYGAFQVFRRLAWATGGLGRGASSTLALQATTYAIAVSVMPFAIFLATGVVVNRGTQQPELEVKSKAHGRSLNDLMGLPVPCEQRKPIIVLAASGGGTRAAVYTAALLQGLRNAGHLDQVRLVSGVSGGGAALAYFAGHRPDLLANDTNWDTYLSRMRDPYIADVIGGLGEWRVLKDTRLGQLLEESFRRRWTDSRSHDPEPRRTLGAVTDIALIFNTSIAARFDAHDVPASERGGRTFIDFERDFRKQRTTAASGRLILTNLALGNRFGASTNIPDVTEASYRPFIVVDWPDTRLTQAAALNANFPPVFSNAAVDLYSDPADIPASKSDATFQNRYWVTDGGALDNRGIEAPLYVLRDAVQDASWGHDCGGPTPVHLIVADAGASSDAFVQDRGISTAIGGGAVFATQLAAELIEDINRHYPNGGFKRTYLPMPDALRRSGSFGTHWMLQPNIPITIPKQPKTSAGREETESIALGGEEVVQIVRALFGVSSKGKTWSSDVERVYESVCPAFSVIWTKLRRDLVWPQGSGASIEPLACKVASDK